MKSNEPSNCVNPAHPDRARLYSLQSPKLQNEPFSPTEFKGGIP